MGEPEAGSEFAIGAATAGETWFPGFGVTMCHPRGTGRILTESKITVPFFPPTIQYPLYSRGGPGAEEGSGQQRVNTPFRTRRIVLLGRSFGSGGEAGNTFKVERTVWRMPCVGRRPGSRRGSETFVICLVLLNGSASLSVK